MATATENELADRVGELEAEKRELQERVADLEEDLATAKREREDLIEVRNGIQSLLNEAVSDIESSARRI
jgi:flagellar motility protein MotE (MotC chaperone)